MIVGPFTLFRTMNMIGLDYDGEPPPLSLAMCFLVSTWEILPLSVV
jgi:hypothetical protein